jgi:hypothetical protein
MTWKKPVARVVGNFGISFFTPLASINIAKALFEVSDGLDFYQTVIASLLAAIITAGLSISREAAEYGLRKERRD